MATDGPLTYRERERIMTRVVLGAPPLPDESPAAAAWRKRCESDVAKCRALGYAPEPTFDPTYGEDDDAPAVEMGTAPAESTAVPEADDAEAAGREFIGELLDGWDPEPPAGRAGA